jgi:hypothetical protein
MLIPALTHLLAVIAAFTAFFIFVVFRSPRKEEE